MNLKKTNQMRKNIINNFKILKKINFRMTKTNLKLNKNNIYNY